MRASRRRLGILCLAAFVVAASEPTPAQQKGKPERALVPPPPFQGSLAQARALATDRNVPLLVVAIFEDEAWDPKVHHDQAGLTRELLAGRDLAEVLQRAIVVLGCNRPHELETIEVVSGETRSTVRRCPAYHTDSCTVHQHLFEDVYAAWNKDGSLVSPHVVQIAPSGEVTVLRDNGSTPTATELLHDLQKAQKAAGEGLTAEEHAKVQQLAATARAAVETGKQGSAWRAWNEMQPIAHASRYAEMARQGTAAALAALETARSQAQAEIDAGRAVPAYEALEALAKDWAGTPRERELAVRLRELEMDKQHRAAIHAFKREREAEALVAEIEALLASGDKRRASAKLRGLLKAYADCPASERARQRWPELAGGQ
jgi:hypothetical protein